MEAVLLHSSSADQESMSSSSSYKKARNHPKRMNNQTRFSVPSRSNSINGNLYHSESLPKMEMMVNAPFPLSSSLPRLNSSPQYHQPPLLPLPVASRQFRSLPISGGATQLSPSYNRNKGNKNQQSTKLLSKQAKKSVSNKRLGPNPESLEVKFCGSVFPEAPPPSSLPMPKFSLKSKMSCRVEANGTGRVDPIGATGNLCRLLNLR